MSRSFETLFGIRKKLSTPLRIALGFIPILAILGIWWAATWGEIVEERLISPVILPSPSEVLYSFPSLWRDRGLLGGILQSVRRVFSGFLLASATAVPLGILMGSFTSFKATFNSVSVIGGYLPIAALVPLTLSWFGVGEVQKIFFLGLASFVFLLPLVVTAIEKVNTVYLQTAYTLGAGRLQTVVKVLIPVALAEIYDALRLVFGIGWTYIILAEIIAAEQGLGHLIITSQRRGPREHIYLVLGVIVLIAFLTDKLLVWGGKFLFPYRRAKR